jgi:hypothetical protein
MSRLHRLAFVVRFARTAALSASGALGVLTLASACATATAAGPGGECSLAADCAPGLVCVEQANKTRICTTDLARVAGKRPPDAAADDGGATDGEAPDRQSPPVVEDSGGGDTGSPPQPPEDTGAPAQDASGD